MVFSHESALHIRWPEYWSFSISSSSEYSGLISFRIDWLDLLAVQGTLKSLLLQHHSLKASILQCWEVQFFMDLLYGPILTFIHDYLWTFFMVQFSHSYTTTGKTTALTRWTFVNKLKSLLFNMLSSFVIAFLPRTTCLLILWLQSPTAVISESKKVKSVTVSIVSPSICMKWWNWMPWS